MVQNIIFQKSLTHQCPSQCRVWLQGILLTEEYNSAVSCLPRSLNSWGALHFSLLELEYTEDVETKYKTALMFIKRSDCVNGEQ